MNYLMLYSRLIRNLMF